MRESEGPQDDRPPAFTCGVCGLHYPTAELARACEEFCRAHDACSLDITAHSWERSGSR